MSWNLFTLPSNDRSRVRTVNNSRDYVYISWRFLRYKFYPWSILALAPLKLLATSGENRTQEKIRYMIAVSKIDFASFYSLINDLLW